MTKRSGGTVCREVLHALAGLRTGVIMRVLRVEHVTEYRFGAFVTLLPHRLLIRPRESHELRVVSSTLDITPLHEVRWSRDMLDNSVATVTFREAANQLRIASAVVVEQYDDQPLDFLVEERALTFPFQYLEPELRMLAPYREASWPQSLSSVNAWLGQLSLPNTGIQTFALLSRLNSAIHESFAYRVREEEGVWAPQQSIQAKAGSCRDLAALFIEACRCLGLASRFVSGYVHTPASESGHGTTHAWAETYLPGP
ncbi:MAG TPA: transglutaminase family protein, partial [Polyangiales bacterium]|nr:transglutaminase family protein [Polyangiales bacterium]